MESLRISDADSPLPPAAPEAPAVQSPTWWLLAAGISSPILVFAGVHMMQRTEGFPLGMSLSTGILADVFPNPEWVLAGTVFVVLGCLVALFQLSSPCSAAPGVGPMVSPGGDMSLMRLWSRLGGIFLGVGAVGAYVYALEQAAVHQQSRGAMLALVAAALASCLVLRLLWPGSPSSGPGKHFALTRIDCLVIVAVIAGFLAINLYNARYWIYAFVGDEWAFYDIAKAIAQGNQVDLFNQAGVYGIHPWADSAYQALSMRLFGMDVVGWRLSCILAAALPIVALYWLAKQLGGAVLAAVACVIYASCHLLWAFSHIGYNNNDALLSMIPSVALLYKGLRDDRHAALFAAGTFAGAGWYTLFTGRLTIGIVGLVILTEWRGGWRAVARRLCLMLAGFLVVVIPLFLDNGLDTIRQMLPLISISQARTSGPVPSLIGQNTVRGIYAFLYTTQATHYVVGAVFDLVSATALCLGCTLALRRCRDLGPRLLLIWLAVGLMLTTPLYYVPQIADTRMQAAIPAAAILAALGLCGVAQTIQQALPRWSSPYASSLTLIGALIAAIVLNAVRFFITMPQDLQPTLIAMTIGALQAAPHSTVILAGDTSNNNLCQVLDGYGIDTARVLQFQGPSLALQCPGSTVTAPARSSSVVALFSDQGIQLAGACRTRLAPIITAPNNQQHVWSLRFSVAPDPAASYAARVAASATQLCPTIGTLPH